MQIGNPNDRFVRHRESMTPFFPRHDMPVGSHSGEPQIHVTIWRVQFVASHSSTSNHPICKKAPLSSLTEGGQFLNVPHFVMWSEQVINTIGRVAGVTATGQLNVDSFKIKLHWSPLVRSAFCPKKVDLTSGLTLHPGNNWFWLGRAENWPYI